MAGAAACQSDVGPQPTFGDDRVSLTPFRLADAPIMVRWDSDPEMQRWLDLPAQDPEGFDHLAHCEHVIREWWAQWEARKGRASPHEPCACSVSGVRGVGADSDRARGRRRQPRIASRGP